MVNYGETVSAKLKRASFGEKTGFGGYSGSASTLPSGFYLGLGLGPWPLLVWESGLPWLEQQVSELQENTPDFLSCVAGPSSLKRNPYSLGVTDIFFPLTSLDTPEGDKMQTEWTWLLALLHGTGWSGVLSTHLLISMRERERIGKENTRTENPF